MTIAADRRLGYHLSYASKWTYLSKLMRRFHDALMQDDDRVDRLRATFQELVDEFDDVAEFNTFKSLLREKVDDLSANFEYALDSSFSLYDPSNYFRSLRFTPTQDGTPRSIEELGSGQEQILAISFAWAYAQAFHEVESMVLVIEEPESNLHPLAQQWLAARLHEIAASDRLQVVVTTHSPAFIRLGSMEGLVRVVKDGRSSQTVQLSREEFAEACRQMGASAATAEGTPERYEVWSSQATLSALFSRHCLLVEGETEALALPVLFRQIGIELARLGVAVVPVSGVSNMAKWWRLYTAYGLSVSALFDKDLRSDRDGGRRADLLSAALVPEAEHAAYTSGDADHVAAGIAALAPDFEGAMARIFARQWSDLEETGRNDFGLAGRDAKPLLARFVSERVEMTTEAATFLEQLALELLPAAAME